VLGFGRKNEHIIPNILGWTSDEEEVRRHSSARKRCTAKWCRARAGARSMGRAPGWGVSPPRAVPCAIGSSTHARMWS